MGTDLGVEGNRIIGALWDAPTRPKLPPPLVIDPPEGPAIPDDDPEPLPSADTLGGLAGPPEDAPPSPRSLGGSEAVFNPIGKAMSN